MKRAETLGPTLETERLILRPPIADDFAGFCAFSGDAEAMKYIGGVQTPPIVWRAMRTIAGGWALDGFHFFSVIEKASGAWIGRIGPLFPHDWPGPEVGWGVAPAFQGRGYGREAATAAMDFAFDVLGWERVIHTIDPANAASAGVARALGSRHIGPGKLPEPYANLPVEIWGQSREEWRGRGA